MNLRSERYAEDQIVAKRIVDSAVARALLEQLGLPTDAPEQPRARDPSTLDNEEPTDDRDE